MNIDQPVIRVPILPRPIELHRLLWEPIISNILLMPNKRFTEYV